MAPEADRPEDHDALVTTLRNGDIVLFNGWYAGDEAGKIKKLYEEAAQGTGDQRSEVGGQ
jgi:hypothetical protein